MPLGKITVREMALFAVLGAMTFGAKYVMAPLPNIEPVSVCMLLYGAVLGRKSLYPAYLYVGMEILFFGLGLWNINYLYIWLVPLAAGWLLRNMEFPLGWAVVSGSFGLLFGALCALVDVVIGGVEYAIAKWISGIPFDIAHCAGNFVIALVLFVPMRKLMRKMLLSCSATRK